MMDSGRSAAMELTSISCKGVKAPFNIFQKPTLYIIVSVSGGGGDRADRTHKTPVDRAGGENPEWDHQIRLHVADRGGVLDFEVKAFRMIADTTVGRARIPLSDLDFTGVLRHGSYQVRAPDGKSNGAISFSYKIDAPHLSDDVNPKIKNEYPTMGLYPPPPPPLPPAMAFDYAPHPQPPTPSAPAFDYGHPHPAMPSAPAFDYGQWPPPSAPGFDYGCLTPDTAASSPPSAYGYGWPAQLGGGEFYPPPQPQSIGYAVYPPPLQASEYAACYPLPPPACCCHEPRDLNNGRWGRGVYGYY